MISSLIHLAEKGILPDFLIRIGIKKLSKVRLDLAKNSMKLMAEKVMPKINKHSKIAAE